MLITIFLSITVGILGCSSNMRQAERHSEILASNTVSLAGGGALAGAKLGVGALPGAGVGLASAALISAIQSFVINRTDDSLLRLENSLKTAKYSSTGQQLLLSYWEIRNKYFPSRDIFPAEFFFEVDSTNLSSLGKGLLQEIYLLNKDRFPWSRFGIISYVTTTDDRNNFSKDLAVKQVRVIGSYLISLGLNPRRVSASASLTDRPLVQTNDPNIDKMFFNAIEFVPLDLVISEDVSG